MHAVRDQWTDERLDDLNHRVDEGFKRNEREFQAVRLEMRTEFAAVRGEMKEEFGSVRSETKEEFAAVRSEIGGLRQEIGATRSDISALSRVIAQACFGALATLLVGFFALIATQL